MCIPIPACIEDNQSALLQRHLSWLTVKLTCFELGKRCMLVKFNHKGDRYSFDERRFHIFIFIAVCLLAELDGQYVLLVYMFFLDQARLVGVTSYKVYLIYFCKEFRSSQSFLFGVEELTVTFRWRTAIKSLFLCFLCVFFFVYCACTGFVSWIDTPYPLFFYCYIVPVAYYFNLLKS